MVVKYNDNTTTYYNITLLYNEYLDSSIDQRYLTVMKYWIGYKRNIFSFLILILKMYLTLRKILWITPINNIIYIITTYH